MNIVEKWYDVNNDTRLQISMVKINDHYGNNQIILYDWWSGRYFYGDTILPKLSCEKESDQQTLLFFAYIAPYIMEVMNYDS